MKSFQEIILELQSFWSREGCAVVQPYDLEKGAGTFNPATFFGALTAVPARFAYVEPSRRPADGRYGDNPNRLGKYYQFQVILKPVPSGITDLYQKSLKAIGLDPKQHDLRWIEDDWESPTLGASGVGWEVWLDGMEITQFTYFQQMGSMPLLPVSVEITYGLERIAMHLQKKDSVYDLEYGGGLTYGDLHKSQEREFSRYHFETADTALLSRHFNEWEAEGGRLTALADPLPAYDCVVRISHLFNTLEARGAISVTERAQYVTRVRNLARKVMQLYIEKNAPKAVEAA
ncbi:MAG TPA: glycine--tRNA ligase subunit alpha [Elusimicrobia bacterium]|nr:MAG: glycine--tRNA ligase subunit alpha [Elusimicrobia bacterium GWA2_66_18]OGR69516.1 MAG: glycine--tRNA ligase subunit alpha [Elusimicrobia bacterium GWC2_65_9]HAZ09144.1 glycine--tRNA ligase subunit alpha [Elusimicrobiota bacterium]